MRMFLIAIMFMISGAAYAASDLPAPQVGELINRGGVLCDTLEQAESIVQAAQDLGWEKGGQVLLDEFIQKINDKGEPTCAGVVVQAIVTAVKPVGRMPYKDKGAVGPERPLEVWLVSVQNPNGSGVLFWSVPIKEA